MYKYRHMQVLTNEKMNFVCLCICLLMFVSSLDGNSKLRLSATAISACSLPCSIHLSSYHPATTMAPLTKYLFPCFKCNSRKELVKRPILAHFKQNLDYLSHLRTSGAHQDTISFVQ